MQTVVFPDHAHMPLRGYLAMSLSCLAAISDELANRRVRDGYPALGPGCGQVTFAGWRGLAQARCPRRQRRNDSIESIMRAPDRLFIRPAVQPWGCR